MGAYCKSASILQPGPAIGFVQFNVGWCRQASWLTRLLAADTISLNGLRAGGNQPNSACTTPRVARGPLEASTPQPRALLRSGASGSCRRLPGGPEYMAPILSGSVGSVPSLRGHRGASDQSEQCLHYALGCAGAAQASTPQPRALLRCGASRSNRKVM